MVTNGGAAVESSVGDEGLLEDGAESRITGYYVQKWSEGSATDAAPLSTC